MRRNSNLESMYWKEKYKSFQIFLNELEPGDAISAATIQQRLNVGILTAKRILEKALQDELVESYQDRLAYVAGGYTDTEKKTFYRIPHQKNA